MKNKSHTRREFLKRNSLNGLGALMLPGIVEKGLSSGASSSAMISEGTVSHFVTGEPAVLGGNPIRVGKKWPEWPIWNSESDTKKVADVLKSGVWSRSKLVTEFEKKWAEAVGAKRCLSVVNGTNALITALGQLNIGVGDEVIVPPYTFIATVASILANGAIPVFVDTDRETFQIDPAKIEAKITSRTKAILPVHILGLPADMDRIMAIAKKHNLYVIEDACQSHLAEYDHKKVGTIGNAGCFSFQNSKNLPIGEGGAIVSNDELFMDKCYSYHNYGYPYGNAIGSVSAGAVIRGTKIRLTEYQAAIGLAQLARLEGDTVYRGENAAYLKSKITGLPGITPYKLYDKVTRSAFHVFPFRYNKEAFGGLSRSAFIKALGAEGVPAMSGYGELNKEPYLNDAFQSTLYKRNYSKKQLDIKKYNEENACPENAILCQEEAVWLFHSMLLGSRSDMDDIAAAIEKVHKNADKIKKSIQS